MPGTVIVTEVKRSPEAQEHVEKRCQSRLCVACQRDPKPARRRGLCTTCEGRWTVQRNNFTAEQAKIDFDTALMNRGLLLEPDEIRELTTENIFADIAQEIVGN